MKQSLTISRRHVARNCVVGLKMQAMYMPVIWLEPWKIPVFIALLAPILLATLLAQRGYFYTNGDGAVLSPVMLS